MPSRFFNMLKLDLTNLSWCFNFLNVNSWHFRTLKLAFLCTKLDNLSSLNWHVLFFFECDSRPFRILELAFLCIEIGILTTSFLLVWCIEKPTWQPQIPSWYTLNIYSVHLKFLPDIPQIPTWYILNS